MKARWLVAPLAVAACASSMVVVAACATNDDVTPADPDVMSSTIPVLDGASDAAALDADATAHVCLPDEVCPNGPFDPGAPGGALDLRTRINVIRGRSANDVWAAGVQGALVHFDGTSWTRSDSGTKETMNGLWLRDSGEIAIASLTSVYTRGVGPTDGGVEAGSPSAGGWTSNGAPAAPASFPATTRTFESSWTVPGAEWLWCATVETANTTDHSVNGLWRLRVAPSTNALEIAAPFPAGMCSVVPCRQLTSLHGVSANDLWAVGYTGAALHITNAQSPTPTITAFDSQTWVGLTGVWAASESEAWAVGGAGVIRHYAGGPSSWEIVSNVPTTETLNAVWGSSASDVWAVGDASVVLHYDGKSWSRVNVVGLGDRHPNLYTVWTSAAGHVWIGGDGALLSLGGKP